MLAYLVGALVDFNQYYYTDQFLPNGYPLANNVSSVIQSACVAQATFAVYCTFGSFMWTLGMALYLYMRMVHHKRLRIKCVLYIVTLFCYLYPVLPNMEISRNVQDWHYNVNQIDPHVIRDDLKKS